MYFAATKFCTKILCASSPPPSPFRVVTSHVYSQHWIQSTYHGILHFHMINTHQLKLQSITVNLWRARLLLYTKYFTALHAVPRTGQWYSVAGATVKKWICAIMRCKLCLSRYALVKGLQSAFKISVVRAPGTTKQVAGQPKKLMQLSDGQP